MATMNDDKLNEKARELKKQGVRLFDCRVRIDRPMGGGMADWPANLQDAVYAALERKAKDVELPLAIIHSYVDSDFEGYWFAVVIASEVVVAPANAKSAIGIVH